MVTFQLFVRPALARAAGRGPGRRRGSSAVLGEAVPRNAAPRPGGARAARGRRRARAPMPTGPQGSHVLTSMLGADGLALIPAGTGEVAAGERVDGGAPVRTARPEAPARAAPARAGARADRARAALQVRGGRQHRQQAGGGGEPAPLGARPRLVARVPRAPGRHLLALPDPLLVRAAAGALHRRRARGGAPAAPVRPAAIPQAGIRDRAQRWHGDLADRQGPAGRAVRAHPRLSAADGAPAA